MGYTNYLHQKRNFTDKEWSMIKAEYDYIKECDRVLDMSENENEIAFNGKDGSCETFVLCKNIEDYWQDRKWIKEDFEKDGYVFSCCKTRMYPYDIDVWYLYTVAFALCKDNITISRDR